MYHKPVLLDACIEGLAINPEGIYVDATFGGGSHSRAILQRLQGGKLVAFDQDKDAEQNIPDDPGITFLNHNFRYMHNFLKLYGLLPVDGILADLGVSSWQFDQKDRGFSTRMEGPLDMRMDQAGAVSAKDIVNHYDQEDLSRIFFLYGELKNSRKIASIIEKERKNQSLDTTRQLMEILSGLAPRGRENKFFAQIFQALRIEVNKELEALKELLEQSPKILKPGGRLVIISYHSLEDRLVKNFMRAGNFTGEVVRDFYGNSLSPLFPLGKVIVPDEDEIAENSRARSAKLRIAEKK